MFGIYKENQRLYLANWDYNACRIINELTIIVENNDGGETDAPIVVKNTLSTILLIGSIVALAGGATLITLAFVLKKKVYGLLSAKKKFLYHFRKFFLKSYDNPFF